MFYVVFFFSSLYRFTPVELAFLSEYAKTMSPVAKALGVLQGEASVQMGWLVPTITLLRTKLDAYLGCPGDTVEVLKSFPAVCQLSLKLNMDSLPQQPVKDCLVLQG